MSTAELCREVATNLGFEQYMGFSSIERIKDFLLSCLQLFIVESNLHHSLRLDSVVLQEGIKVFG